MIGALEELADYFRTGTKLRDEDLARLALAARGAGSRWEAIAAACGVSTYKDLSGVIYRDSGESGAELLYSATQSAVRDLTGTGSYRTPLTWTCQPCGQQVTDRAPAGRPIHIEHGHSPGCTWLARDQARVSRVAHGHVDGPSGEGVLVGQPHELHVPARHLGLLRRHQTSVPLQKIQEVVT